MGGKLRGRLLVGNPHMAGTCLPKPVLLRISIARFVSESSHNGGRAPQNRRHRPLHPQFVSRSSHDGGQARQNRHLPASPTPTL